MKTLLCTMLAALSLACGPSFGGEAKTGGIPVSGAPPMVMMMQPGGHPMAAGQFFGPGPLVSTETTVANNVAAGIGNAARQNLGAMQAGGRGGAVDANTLVTTSVAGGVANFAGQYGFAHQR